MPKAFLSGLFIGGVVVFILLAEPKVEPEPVYREGWCIHATYESKEAFEEAEQPPLIDVQETGGEYVVRVPCS